MRMLLAAALSLTAGIAYAQAPASPHTFTGKVALYSEYEYRGQSQTSEKPALQLTTTTARRGLRVQRNRPFAGFLAVVALNGIRNARNEGV